MIGAKLALELSLTSRHLPLCLATTPKVLLSMAA
jgi:hypothetical protein